MPPATPSDPPPLSLTQNVFAKVAHVMAGPQDRDALESALRILAKWRSQMLLNTILQKDGATVQSGPFAGMVYTNAASEGSGAARLLGCYEVSLAPIIAQIVRSDYPQIIDLGCAEGYYAVGLARAMPGATVIARDANPAALELCKRLAADNGVTAQMRFGGLMDHADFDLCLRAKTLLICDIEGAEAALIDPNLAPGLLAADILIETHDCITPGLAALIANRFAASHDIVRIDRALDSAALPDWAHGLSDLDRLLCLWEWRNGPTPWLWMTKKEAV